MKRGSHMALFDGILGNASQVNLAEVQREYAQILAPQEKIERAYKLIRDMFIFTDKRLILVDKQGLTGKKTDYHSIPTKTMATILPSATALIILLEIMQKYKQSPIVKGMTLLVQPVIAVMMAVLTWKMAKSPADSIGVWQTLIIAAIAFWAMKRLKLHPALVILAAFAYGGLVLRYTV